MNGFETIFSIKSEQEFNEVALQVFRYQAQHNTVYKQFIEFLKVDVESVHTIEKIPFLPIQFFKTHQVVSGNGLPEKIFTSSGTSDVQTSQHFVTDLEMYRQSLIHSFAQFYGNL